MPVRRINLEPIGRFAFLAVGVHLLLGGVLWWWLQHSQAPLAESPGQGLTWISPADFSSVIAEPKASSQPLAPPSTPPAPVAEHTPPPASPPATSPPAATEPSPPPPAKVAENTPLPAPPPPEVPVPPPAKMPVVQEDSHSVPKAIAIDPAQAMAIMAKAQAAEAAKAAEKEKNKPPVSAAAAAPPPPVPPVPATPPSTENSPSPPAPAGTDTSRFVTVSLKASAPGSSTTPKVASLLDMATLDQAGTGATGAASGVRLDEVDRAVIDAFMKEWLPPDASKLRVDQRTAHLDMAIDRTGRVLNFKLTQPSGSIDLDMSVLEAADRLDKIGAQLPPSFPKDRYEFQVNLHAE